MLQVCDRINTQMCFMACIPNFPPHTLFALLQKGHITSCTGTENWVQIMRYGAQYEHKSYGYWAAK